MELQLPCTKPAIWSIGSKIWFYQNRCWWYFMAQESSSMAQCKWRLQYLQWINNGDIWVMHWAIKFVFWCHKKSAVLLCHEKTVWWLSVRLWYLHCQHYTDTKILHKNLWFILIENWKVDMERTSEAIILYSDTTWVSWHLKTLKS